jgi:hypothetical protein
MRIVKTVEDEIGKLLERRGKLDARMRELRLRERKKKRAKDNRLKYISGGLILAYVKKKPEFAAEFTGLVNQLVPRPEDRKLYEDFMNDGNADKRPASPASEGFADAAAPPAPDRETEPESA